MLRDKIIGAFHEIARTYGVELVALQGDTVLLECGLDSLGLAALVALLEEDLGYDPFVMTDVPAYPRTLDDFVGVYGRVLPEQE